MRLVREPVVQFLVLGGGLFAAYSALAPLEEPPREEIVVAAGRVESLAANFERAWHRRPTDEELDGLVQDYIAEEVLYREAVKLGLEQDDLVVRRRMRQKMELLLGDAVSAAAPDDDSLRQYYEANKEQYRQPTRFSFRQIFLGPGNGRPAPEAWAALAEELNGQAIVDIGSLNTASPLPVDMAQATKAEVSRLFGEDFSAALQELMPHRWSDPLRSAYGWHLVQVSEIRPSADGSLEEVRDKVERDFLYDRERGAQAELIEQLKKRYVITVEDSPP